MGNSLPRNRYRLSCILGTAKCQCFLDISKLTHWHHRIGTGICRLSLAMIIQSKLIQSLKIIVDCQYRSDASELSSVFLRIRIAAPSTWSITLFCCESRAQAVLICKLCSIIQSQAQMGRVLFYSESTLGTSLLLSHTHKMC